MGKLKEKKLNKDIKELEEIEHKQHKQFQQTRDRVLNYSTEQRRNTSNSSDSTTGRKADSRGSKTSGQVSTKLETNAAYVARECIELLSKKNQDYGPDNINNAPGGALNGLNVRLFDKVSRLNNLLINKKDPNYESIRDTFTDIVNYAIISILVIDNKWESTK